MNTLPVTPSAYQACPAQSFRAEFGVCRGECISQLGDLIPGDIYNVESKAKWLPVDAIDSEESAFTMEIAANLPREELVTVAQLIFMTTTGRRADVFATMSHGQMHIVAETPLLAGHEYVLIDIQTRDTDFAPFVVPAPVEHVAYMTQVASNVVPLRLIG